MLKEVLQETILFQKKKALFASKKNVSEVEKIKKELSKKDIERKKEAKDIVEKIQNKTFDIKKLSTENKELYGSVKPTEISKILQNSENVEINPSVIQPIKEIKTLGKFKVSINLHSEVQTNININVISEEIAK